VNNATKHVGKYSDMEIPSNSPAYVTKWECTCLIRDGKDTMSYGKPPWISPPVFHGWLEVGDKGIKNNRKPISHCINPWISC